MNAGAHIMATQIPYMSRRRFCLCCAATSTFVATSVSLRPKEAFAEARGIVESIKASAAVAPISTYPLCGGVSVLEGSGGNIAVLSGREGKLLVDCGIAMSRPQISKPLNAIGPEPVTHLIDTHWHFDHAGGNAWVQSNGAKIITHEKTRARLTAA
jgi:beta-lactamase superfamily II metal-dependent hydrolase